MNPIVSAGRHHNERPFTGRHQMSSRVLSRGFVRDTFNSSLALCLPRGGTRYLLFLGCSIRRHRPLARARPRCLFPPRISVSRVPPLVTLLRREKREKSCSLREESAPGTYCPRCVSVRGKSGHGRRFD